MQIPLSSTQGENLQKILWLPFWLIFLYISPVDIRTLSFSGSSFRKPKSHKSPLKDISLGSQEKSCEVKSVSSLLIYTAEIGCSKFDEAGKYENFLLSHAKFPFSKGNLSSLSAPHWERWMQLSGPFAHICDSTLQHSSLCQMHKNSEGAALAEKMKNGAPWQQNCIQNKK